LRQYSFSKKLQSQTVIREKLRKTLLHEKAALKMLGRLTPCLSGNPVFPNFPLKFVLKRFGSDSLQIATFLAVGKDRRRSFSIACMEQFNKNVKLVIL